LLDAGVKVKAVGDSLDVSDEVLVEADKEGADTKGSWDPKELELPALPFGLKLVLARTRLKGGGTLGREIPWAPGLRSWTFSGEKGESFVAGVPWWDSTSSDELGLTAMPLRPLTTAIIVSL
jgi:hypothetical protein